MPPHFRVPSLFLAGFLSLVASASRGATENDAGLQFFEKKIRPVLAGQCYECHSAQSQALKGEFRLDTREGIRRGGASGRDAVVPGNVAASRLIEALRRDNPDLQMPPKHALAPEIVADFEQWIAMGAPDPRENSKFENRNSNLERARHWAWQKPQRHIVPESEDPVWNRDSIDRLVRAKLKEKGLEPSLPADRGTLLRRLALELTGLPPAPEEIAAFLADARPDDVAVAAVADRLLASDGFGVRWGRHWLDVARFGESSGHSRNMLYPHAWRYRDYVINSFNADKPFDRFIREQIAGDLLPAENPARRDEQIIATGFLTVGPKTLNDSDLLLFRLNCADDQIDVTCRAFMALTANCARCHDHKYDPVPTKDYYAMAGIFLSSRNLAGSETNVRNEQADAWPLGENGWKKLEEMEAAKKKADDTQAAYLEQVKVRNELRDPLEKQKIDWRKNPTPELAAAEAKVQAMQAEVKAAREAIPAPPEFAMAVIDGLNAAAAEAFAREQAAAQTLVDATKKAGKAAKPAIPDRPKIADSPVYDKGVHKSPLDPVPRGALSLFGYPAAPVSPDQSGRLQLADWIVDRRNPLTARVFVNRVWHHLFGRGLVETVDNFGVLGAAPSHPELLDELALDFMEQGWSVKKLVRRIVLSQAWRQSSAFRPEAAGLDPGNTFLWRFSPRLLEGEAIRDGILAVSGSLDPKPPSFSQVAEISKQFPLGQQREIGRRNYYEKDVTWDVNCRSAYLPMAREKLPDMLAAFDAPDPNLVAGDRTLTVVPAQALYLMNSDWVIQESRRAGQRFFDQPAAERIAFAFLSIFGREPFPDERARIDAFAAENGDSPETWARIAQALFCSGEFRTIY